MLRAHTNRMRLNVVAASQPIGLRGRESNWPMRLIVTQTAHKAYVQSIHRVHGQVYHSMRVSWMH